MFDRLKAMLVKEFIQVLRDPRMRFVMFVIPVVQTLVFGYAVNTDVREVSTAIYDLDNSSQSREIAALFIKSGYFRLREQVYDDARAQELIDRGEVKAVLRMNHGLGERLAGGEGGTVQLILDGTDSNTAGIALNYASRIVGGYSARVQLDAASRKGGAQRQLRGVELESRAWYNENLESRNYYVPAVITNIVFIITMLLSSMAVVREKEIGTIEQVIVTPIGKGEFILGKTVPFVLIGFINVTIISLVAVFWFDVPMRGSILLLFGSTALFLMSSLGIGLLISTRHTPLRLRLSHRQHAALRAVDHLREPDAVFPGHHPLHLPERGGDRHPLAAADGPAADRDHHPLHRRAAVQEDSGVRSSPKLRNGRIFLTCRAA